MDIRRERPAFAGNRGDGRGEVTGQRSTLNPCQPRNGGPSHGYNQCPGQAHHGDQKQKRKEGPQSFGAKFHETPYLAIASSRGHGTEGNHHPVIEKRWQSVTHLEPLFS